MTLVALSVVLILAVLALVHVYWGVVGVSSRPLALPEVEGQPAFLPSRLATFSVALALALAALLVFFRSGIAPSPVPPPLVHYGTVGVGLVFLLRAIGDFRLVGFFKRVRGTRFATWDTRLFSPLCLALGLATLWVAAT